MITSFVIAGWIPVCAMLFLLFRPVQALTLSYLIGWLVLPMAEITIPGFWDIDKMLATNAGAFLGMIVFRSDVLRRYRFSTPDGLLFLFCGASFVASVANDLGVYDGCSATGRTFFWYGMPYLLARIVIRNRQDLITAARLIVLGASAYACLALWEWRMSPRLHIFFYGFFQHGWGQLHRWGFWRPIVFFPHSLALGVFFAWTSLLAIAMYRARCLKPPFGLPAVAMVVSPLVGLATSMSFGPWGLFLVGLGMLMFPWRADRRWLMILPILAAAWWMGTRYTGLSDGAWMTAAFASLSEERAESLDYRINAETLLIDRAKMHPIVGWGGWGRSRIRDEDGRDLVKTDGLWVLILGTVGLVGLTCFYLWWCWPVVMSVSRGAGLLREPVLLVVLIAINLQAVNFLFNAFFSPILIMMCGAATTMVCQMRERGPDYSRQEQRYRHPLG